MDDHVNVIGDRDLLFEAISNLVGNGIKHGGPKGSVTVTASYRADGAFR